MHTLEVPVGSLNATVVVFGHDDAEHYGLESWSLKPLQRPADVFSNQRLAQILSQELEGFDINEAFAPNVVPASGQIVSTADLTDQLWMKGTRLYRNKALPADGVLLEQNQAFMMSGAGCPLIIATAGEDMIVAHAARDSLIDRGAVVGKPTRKHVSVVDAMIEKFQKRGALLSDIVMVMLFAIPANEFEHHFDHPKYGEYNCALATFIFDRWSGGINWGNGYLDLERVFVEQAHRAGVLRAWAGNSLAQYPKLVHTCVGDNVGKRNLFIVKRTD